MTTGRDAQGKEAGAGLTRRRTLRILGAAAGAPLLAPAAVWSRAEAWGPSDRPGGAVPRRGIFYDAGAAGRGAGSLVHWRGAALGADALITLYHPDGDAARRIIAACLDEVARLERIFSLHAADSEITRLNAAGRIEAPSHDMVRLLSIARRFAALSEGAFDITVQPLWRLYAAYFARRPGDAEGPPEGAVAATRARVDYRKIHVRPDRIRLAGDGMAVTLNGIAQGYITDRVAALLRRAGIGNVLVALGETRALGTHPEGRPWRVGLADPAAPARTSRTIALTDRAVASSGGYGAPFEPTGRHHHLFDPATGRSAGHYAGVSVVAARATMADALSTALYALAPERGAALLRRLGGVTAYVTHADGQRVTLRG